MQNLLSLRIKWIGNNSTFKISFWTDDQTFIWKVPAVLLCYPSSSTFIFYETAFGILSVRVVQSRCPKPGYLRVSGVMGPVAVGRAGPRLLSEEEEETEPLRAETARATPPADPDDTHCDCLHAARVACRDDLSGKAPSKYQQHPHTSTLTTARPPRPTSTSVDGQRCGWYVARSK